MQLDHKHLVLRAEVDNCPAEESLHEILEWMKSLIKKIDMKLMQGPSVSYVDQLGNRGTTCMALIETSHIVIHIWDEPNPGLIQLDIYSCKEFKLDIVMNHIKQYFNVLNMQYKFLDRTTGMKIIDES
jgi:S-adenosylmethionine/arginine decarboxylase-like enzyme